MGEEGGKGVVVMVGGEMAGREGDQPEGDSEREELVEEVLDEEWVRCMGNMVDLYRTVLLWQSAGDMRFSSFFVMIFGRRCV
jgi:hypothetical protein